MKLRGVGAENWRRLRPAKGQLKEELADRAHINRNYRGLLEREEHAATGDSIVRNTLEPLNGRCPSLPRNGVQQLGQLSPPQRLSPALAS